MDQNKCNFMQISANIDRPKLCDTAEEWIHVKNEPTKNESA